MKKIIEREYGNNGRKPLFDNRKKIIVYLENDLYQSIENLSVDQKISKSKIVRDILVNNWNKQVVNEQK